MAILTEEQTLLRDAAREFAKDRAPVAAFRKFRDAGGWRAGHDAALYGEMASLGWPGVLVPEAHGGAGFGYVGLGLVLEELGRTLAPSPLHSTCAAVAALMLAGGEAQQAEWLPRIAAGQCVAALAVDEGAHHDPAAIATTATAAEGGFVLHGRKRFVPDGAAAGVLVVAALRDGAPALFLVPAGAAGLGVTALQAIDNRGAADIALDGVRVPASAAMGQGAALLDAVLDRARITLAAEMLGTAAQAFEVTLDYLKTRRQFGQLIGSFQALQHRAAKLFTDLELTRSCVERALAALDAEEGDVPALASLAKARANETLHLASIEMVQLHGGIGMTDAHDAGLYMKRARVTEALYGSSAFHRDRYAALGGY